MRMNENAEENPDEDEDGSRWGGAVDAPSSSFPADFPEIDPSSWSVKFFSCSQRTSICSSGSAGSSFGLNASAPTVKKPSLIATWFFRSDARSSERASSFVSCVV